MMDQLLGLWSGRNHDAKPRTQSRRRRRKLLRRLKRQPRFEPLEVRNLMTADVSISSVSDATEGGDAGYFQLQRTGDTSDWLSVYYSIDTESSTAEEGYDFDYLSGYADFPGDESTVDIPISVYADGYTEGDETLTPNDIIAAECQE